MPSNLILCQTSAVNNLPQHASPCVSKLKFLVVLCIGCYSAFTFLFSLALQGYQPFRTEPPTGRCNKMFEDAKRVSALPIMNGTLWGYRYDAGHSGVMVCTDLPLETFTKEFADNKKINVSDPWAFQAKDWTSGKCDLEPWHSWFSRINTETPIQCPSSKLSCGLPANLDDLDPLEATPAPFVNSTMSDGLNGPWWDYAITFTTAFNATSSKCGSVGPDNGINLIKNDLPRCEKRYVWAFESNENDLILYYKVILVLFFVPHGMYIIMGIRFWCNVGAQDAVAARFYADGHSGLGSIVFLLNILCCCCCNKGERLKRFEAKYVYTEKGGIIAGIKGTDKLPPVSWLVFFINLALSLVEASFTVIALWGCKAEQLTEPSKLMLVGVLLHATIGIILVALSARPKKRAESLQAFEEVAVKFGDAKRKDSLNESLLINNGIAGDCSDSPLHSSSSRVQVAPTAPPIPQPYTSTSQPSLHQQPPLMPQSYQQPPIQPHNPQQQQHLQYLPPTGSAGLVQQQAPLPSPQYPSQQPLQGSGPITATQPAGMMVQQSTAPMMHQQQQHQPGYGAPKRV